MVTQALRLTSWLTLAIKPNNNNELQPPGHWIQTAPCKHEHLNRCVSGCKRITQDTTQTMRLPLQNCCLISTVPKAQLKIRLRLVINPYPKWDSDRRRTPDHTVRSKPPCHECVCPKEKEGGWRLVVLWQLRRLRLKEKGMQECDVRSGPLATLTRAPNSKARWETEFCSTVHSNRVFNFTFNRQGKNK